MRLKLKSLDSLSVNWEGPDEPPGDRCSFCEAPLKEDDVPLVMWSSEGWTARFCDRCAEKHIEVERS
jgi:hypothetical protein